jgi:hypothetical protein
MPEPVSLPVPLVAIDLTNGRQLTLSLLLCLERLAIRALSFGVCHIQRSGGGYRADTSQRRIS